MPATHNIDVYRRNQVHHASPIELVVMLYDKAIALLKAGVGHMEQGRVAEKGQALCYAVDIVSELQAVLDKERGGQIADKLHALYTYMLERLTSANLHNDPQPVVEVVRLLEELQQGWKGLAGQMVGGSQAVTCRASGAAARQLNSVG